VARRREGRIGRLAEALLHQPAHGGEAERRRLQHVGAWVGGQGGQQVRLLGLRLGARGDEQRDLQLLQAREEVGEEAQRGRVGPVGIVDAEHDEPVGGEVRAQPVEAVQDRERRVGRRRRRLAVPQGAGQTEHASGQPRRALQQIVALGGRGLMQHGLEELAHHAEGEVALELGPPGSQEPRRAVLCPQPGGGEHRRLADPRRALDDHAATRSRACRCDRRVDALKLSLALEEEVDPVRRRGCHRLRERSRRRSGEGAEPSSRDRAAAPASKAGRGTGPGPLRGRCCLSIR
jgi:hypothetical protein